MKEVRGEGLVDPRGVEQGVCLAWLQLVGRQRCRLLLLAVYNQRKKRVQTASDEVIQMFQILVLL